MATPAEFGLSSTDRRSSRFMGTPPNKRPSMRRKQTLLSFRSEEHTSELQSLMRISYAVFCLKKKTIQSQITDVNLLHNDIAPMHSTNNTINTENINHPTK